MTYTLAFSPCPNDTFIFDALVNKKIDTEGMKFNVRLEDVQTLNEFAIAGEASFTKISFGVYPLIMKHYSILNSGSALGRGVGPLLITKSRSGKKEINEQQVAIPGENTTAHLLFSLAFPEATKKVFLRYDEIEKYVLENDAPGVIIHENRFTYQKRGLHKVIDLGAYWEQETGYPIPLGGIVGRKNLGKDIIEKVDRLIKKSLEYSFAHYPEISPYVRDHSQEMEIAVIKQHIDLYVNDFSLNLGEKGHAAIQKLLSVYNQNGPLVK